MNVGPNQGIYLLHASLTDFLMGPTRSKELWINPRTRHAAFARRSLQLKGKLHCFCHFILRAYIFLKRKCSNVVVRFLQYHLHLENAEMMPELREDLMNFSFKNLQDVFKNRQIWKPDRTYNILTFFPPFAMALKKLSLVCYVHHSHVLYILTYSIK